ncbi:hypothetical protein Mal15_39990 [Stieleria maiorica]|uniref:Cytochrome c domain-containing protein n=1 Tax=Stieleria maiorica TaxID=2795974 RepID=A0A5B9MFC2_9BACT|nr:hypothetical protein [Stieleria maiorica]QEF99932.1 hypothetical protein Mal15_39990 [Stieleria maiorica]
MKRFAILFGCLALLASPALATSEFSKQWKNKYLSGDDVDADFVKKARKHGCYICHVNKEDKKKVRNEYGKAIHEFLKAEDFPKDWVKENPEEAEKLIYAGFEKAGEKKSKDGKTFAEKIKAGEVPATDSGKE